MNTKVRDALLALNQSEIARKFNVTRAAVNFWAHRGVPIKRVYDVAELTGLEPHEIRPDIYRAPEREPAQ